MGSRSSVVLGFVFAALLTLAAMIALNLGVNVAGAAWPSGRGHLVLAAAVEIGVYLGFARALAGRGESRLRVPFLRPTLSVVLLSCALGVFLHGPLDFLDACVQRLAPLPESQLRERAMALLPALALERAALFVLVAGFVPLVEELFFRGALFGRLESLIGSSWTLLITSLCFTVSHAEPRSWLPLLAVAYILGSMRRNFGSLWPPILLHATFNATTLSVVFMSPRDALVRPEPSVVAAISGTLASAVLIRFLWSTPRNARLA
jgi:membrane protease YdiL (CAAX protease family)